MRLRDVQVGDVEAYVRMRCDPVMMAELGGPLPREGIEEKVRRDAKAAAEDTSWIKIIIPDEHRPDVVAGLVCLWSHEEDGEEISEIGWMVLPEFQGRGLAKRAVGTVLAQAREDGRWGIVHAFPGATNGPSNGICRSLGFRYLGSLDVDFADRILQTNHWTVELGADPVGHHQPMITIGFLHTSDVHVPTFRALLNELAPAATDLHVVDASLLADARKGLPYTDRLRARLAELAAADVIMCTCSTIGGVVEQLAPDVLRGDRPMAEEAARYARIGVVYTVESTLEPTRALLTEAGATELVEVYCPEAWPLFEAGDLPGYHAAVAERVRGAAASVDVIVLAQASMVPATDLLADLDVPILNSPRLGVLRALDLAAAR